MLSIFRQPVFYFEKRFHISIASKSGEGLVASDETHTVNIDNVTYYEEKDDDDGDDGDDDDDELSNVITVENLHVKIGNRCFHMPFTCPDGHNHRSGERKFVESNCVQRNGIRHGK